MERNGINLKIIPGLFFLFLFLLQSIAFAEVKEIIAEGTYNMGDGETPTVAESRALLNAKRIAIEQAGTYIESYSKITNFQLTHDEIQGLAAGVIEVTVLDKKRTLIEDGIKFWVKIKAKVSTDKMEEMARMAKKKLVFEDYKRLEKDYATLAEEMEILKRQFKGVKSEIEKGKVEAKITETERLFKANNWLEKAKEYNSNKEYDNAIDAFTNAISLNPNFAIAYRDRGVTFLIRTNMRKQLKILLLLLL